MEDGGGAGGLHLRNEGAVGIVNSVKTTPSVNGRRERLHSGSTFPGHRGPGPDWLDGRCSLLDSSTMSNLVIEAL